MTQPIRRLTPGTEGGGDALVPLSVILLNSSAELLRMATLVRSVEDAIFDAAVIGGAPSSQPSGNLHHLDFLLQTLTELSGVFCRLSETAGDEIAVTTERVLDPVRLACLREALISSPHAEPLQELRSSKSIELF